MRSQRSRLGIRLAEVRRRLQVDQVVVGVLFEERIPRYQLLPTSHFLLLHFRGAVELLLQLGADQAETGHRAPTSLHLTGSRDAVTLTLYSHVVLDNLENIHLIVNDMSLNVRLNRLTE